MRLLGIWTVIFAVLLIRIDHEPSPRSRIGYTAGWEETDKSLACLTANVYMEARGESLQGQIAVAQVVMNRAKHNRENVCKVVLAKSQFSWTLDKRITIRNNAAFRMAAYVAKNVLNGNFYDHSRGADHYHADYVAPKWAKADCMNHKVTIGRHIFFKCHYGRYKTS